MKLDEGDELVARESDFPGREAGATLKPFLFATVWGVTQKFPWPRGWGYIEALNDMVPPAAAVREFPWPRGWGYIEACISSAYSPVVMRFPWPRGWGYIEARGVDGYVTTYQDFPGREAGATLKLQEGHDAGRARGRIFLAERLGLHGSL